MRRHQLLQTVIEMRYMSDGQGKIIDAKENHIVVTIQGKYDVEVKVIPKAKKKEIKKPTTTPWEAV